MTTEEDQKKELDNQLPDNAHINDSSEADLAPQQTTAEEKPPHSEGSEKGCSCNSSVKGVMEQSFVYAIGRIEPRFRSLGLEKEYRQAVGRIDTNGQTDYEAMRSALSQKSNRYLARQMCWVLTVEGLETYIIYPRDPADFDLLIEAVRAPPRRTDIDVIVGVRGPIATPEMCNGLMVPIVAFDQVYSFDADSLIKSIPRPEQIPAKQFTATAEELLDRIMQLADNVGSTDEHRAVNYLAVRYQAVYANTAEMHGRNYSLSAVEVTPSRLSGTRKIVDVIFSYRNRNTDVVEKYFVRVDVTEEFPFLVSPLSIYYDR